MWDITIKLNSLHTCINNVFFFHNFMYYEKIHQYLLDINKYILTISVVIVVNNNLENQFEEARKHFSALCLPYYRYANLSWRCYQTWAAVIFQPASATPGLPLAIKHDFNTICTLHYLSTVSCITGRDIPLMSINLF